jgi:hypothetical protein
MLDFTARDYNSLEQEADSILTEMLPEWTSRDDEDINWVTVKTICKLLTISNFYIDLAFNENIPSRVQIYKNALTMAKQKNMPIKKKIGAGTTLILQIDESLEPFTLPRGTIFPSPIGSFVLENDVDFPAGTTQNTGYVVFGKYVTGELLNNNQPYQSIKIEQNNIADRTVRIYVNGTKWEEEVDTLSLVKQDEEKYKLWLDNDMKYIVEFGDNKFGKIPVGTIAYDAIILDLNTLGRLPQGNITKCSNPTIKNVIQNFPAAGGNFDETIESIRKRLDIWELVQNRLVNTKDALFLTTSVPGVSGAKISTKNLRYYINISTEGGVPSPGLIAKVQDYLDRRKIEILDIEVGSLVNREFACEVTLTLSNQGSRSRIKALMEERILELNNKGSLGNNIEILDFYQIIANMRDENIGLLSGRVDKLHRTDSSIDLFDIILGANESVTTGTDKITINLIGGL